VLLAPLALLAPLLLALLVPLVGFSLHKVGMSAKPRKRKAAGGSASSSKVDEVDEEALEVARARIDFEDGSCEQDDCRNTGSAFDVLHLCIVCARASCVACCTLCDHQPAHGRYLTEPGADAVCFACSASIVRAALGEHVRNFVSSKEEYVTRHHAWRI
jgi:hypothetical protein